MRSPTHDHDPPDIFDYRTDPALAALTTKAAELRHTLDDLQGRLDDAQVQATHAAEDQETAECLAVANALPEAELAQARSRRRDAEQRVRSLKGAQMLAQQEQRRVQRALAMTTPALQAQSRDSVQRAYLRLARQREQLLQRLEALDAEMQAIWTLAAALFKPPKADTPGAVPYRAGLVQLHDAPAAKAHHGWRRRHAQLQLRAPAATAE